MEMITSCQKFNLNGKCLSYPKKADIIRISIVGDRGVGKTAFMKCAILGSYDPYMQSVIHTDFMTREISADTDKVVIQLWESQCHNFHSIIIMYDVTCRQSFINASKKLQQVRLQYGVDLPVLLLGNKIDADKKREVIAWEGELLALEHGSLFNEISCIKSVNVRQCMVDFMQSMFTLDVCAASM